MIEGPDGVGKGTQTALLCERLAREGVRVSRYSFPTYDADPVAALIRAMLREHQEDWTARPWESKALLFAANRKRFAEELALRFAAPGAVVVCDRYVPTNQAHMAAIVDNETEWQRRFDWIARLEYELLGLPRPDIVLLHTMPESVSQRLMARRGEKDAHEADAEYLTRVVRCFFVLAAREPAVWRHIPADVAGHVEPPDAVHARVWSALIAHPAFVGVTQPAVR